MNQYKIEPWFLVLGSWFLVFGFRVSRWLFGPVTPHGLWESQRALFDFARSFLAFPWALLFSFGRFRSLLAGFAFVTSRNFFRKVEVGSERLGGVSNVSNVSNGRVNDWPDGVALGQGFVTE